MTNEERRSFPNLILLCVPHHDLIDHKEPDEYTVEILRVGRPHERQLLALT